VFQKIRPAILQRMRYLEEVDRKDREDGTPRLRRLRQISPETGKFIALHAANTPGGAWLEIGTSAGYSTMWLALACEHAGRKLTTFEILPDKIQLARETLRSTGIDRVVDLVEGDARGRLGGYPEVAFCFLDAEKEVYAACYDILIPNLVPGGILVADNAISHREALQPMLDRALADERVDAMIVSLGKGMLLCRKG